MSPARNSSVRVLNVDPNHLACQLLSELLNRDDSNVRIVTCSHGPTETLETLGRHAIDVLLLSGDVVKNDGSLLRKVRTTFPDVRTVMIVDRYDREFIVGSFQNGCHGVFSRDEPISTLSKCIRVVHEGQIWVNNEQVTYLLEALSSHTSYAMGSPARKSLTDREVQIVNLISEGMSNREVSHELGLSEHTIKNHVFRIFEKLGVGNRAELVVHALTERAKSREQAA